MLQPSVELLPPCSYHEETYTSCDRAGSGMWWGVGLGFLDECSGYVVGLTGKSLCVGLCEGRCTRWGTGGNAWWSAGQTQKEQNIKWDMTENLPKSQKCQFKSCGFDMRKSEEWLRKGGLWSHWAKWGFCVSGYVFVGVCGCKMVDTQIRTDVLKAFLLRNHFKCYTWEKKHRYCVWRVYIKCLKE